MLDGAADGTPPLHPDMDLRTWIDSFTDTYKQLRKQIERHQLSQIDPYAVEKQTEVFDVVSEECFCASDWLYQYHADIYLQMACSIGRIQCCVFHNS